MTFLLPVSYLLSFECLQLLVYMAWVGNWWSFRCFIIWKIRKTQKVRVEFEALHCFSQISLHSDNMFSVWSNETIYIFKNLVLKLRPLKLVT